MECELTYGLDIVSTKKGTIIMGGRNKDWIRSVRYSGNYSLNFNFVLVRNDHHIQCSYCGKFVNEKKITRDHVYPKSKGGLIKSPACKNCNEDKADMKPIEFAIWFSKIGRDLATIPIGFDEFDDP